MFSPTKLHLEPSKALALFASIPFVCAWLLIALADIPITGSLALLASVTLCWWYFVRKYALLKSRNSAFIVEHLDSNFFLTDASGERLSAEHFSASIIHPWFTLVSFRCHSTAESDSFEVSDTENNSRYYRLLSHKVRPYLSKVRQYHSKVRQYHSKVRQCLPKETSRHLLICRYNVSSLNEYRRLRVALKFS